MARDRAAYMAEWKRRNPDAHHAIEARYMASEKARETHRRSRAAYKERNADRIREQTRIRVRLLYHIRQGHIQKTPCAVCGSEPVHAHHHNGYDREHELDVVWLCALHHTDAHGRTGWWRRVAAGDR